MLPSFPASPAPVPSDLRLPPDTAASVAAVARGAAGPASDSEPAPAAPPRPGPIVAFAELLAAADTSACSPATRPCMPRLPSSEIGCAAPATPCPRLPSPRRAEALDSEKSETTTPDAIALILAGLVQPAAPVSTEPVPTLDLAGGPVGETGSDEAAASSPPIFPRTPSPETYPSGCDMEAISGPQKNPPSTAEDISAPAAVSSAIPPPAVFAEQPQPRSRDVGVALRERLKNNSQVSEGELTTKREDRAGMEKAKEGAVMGSASAEFLFAPAAATSRRGIDPAKTSASIAEPATATGSLSSPPMQGSAFAAPAGTSPTTFAETAPAPLPAAAVHLVERVDAVAAHVASRSSEPVKLSVDLDGDHRVEVKVAMRGGRVFADFRTDSAEMRAALSHAWAGFVRGRDGTAERWAEPVFSSFGSAALPGPETVAAAPSPSGSFEGDLSSRQETSADQRHAPRREPPLEENAFPFAPSSSPRLVPAASSAVGPRPDASRLLSALA